MDCKAFARLHSGFLDDTLPGVERAAMREHLSSCTRCANKDAEIRRALLVLKNLPPIQVSDGFQDRLRARLAAESAAPAKPRPKPKADTGLVKWAAAAALLIAVVGVRNWPADSSEQSPSRLPAVVASVPAIVEGTIDESAPAYMASMSTGIPMWPALMLAEEGPLRFAATEASRHHD
jgi:anti-sigma factor RsiW